MILTPYPAYKPTGVEWIGDIPEHWELEKAKWLFLKADRLPKSDDDIVTAFRDGQVTLRKNRRIDGFTNALKEHAYQGIRKGDLVINAMDAFAGSIGVSDSDGKSTPVYSACIPRNENQVNPYFYAYYMRDLALSGFIVSLAKGIRERSTDFRFNDFSDLYLPAPPISEQTTIATFLDQKTAQIEQAISIKQQQIALLKERKQIIIQQAVTKGLNPNATMKDSGVEWIGDIPEHWEVKALKYIAFMQSGATISPEQFIDEGYPVYGGNGFRGCAKNYTNDGEFVLIGRQGALCGNVNYASGKFYASEHAIVVYPLKNESVRWLGELIRVADFNRLSQSAAQPGIAVNIIKNEFFPYPPLHEQTTIATFLDQKTEQIDQTIAIQQQQIDRLKEYKTTLINSVVTGKVRVSDDLCDGVAKIDKDRLGGRYA
jgi:type I restriction enzyme S subunit